MKLVLMLILCLLISPAFSFAKDCSSEAQCRQFAQEGDLESQFKLGISYDKAYRTGKKELRKMAQNQAVYWFKKAAEQGHTDAQILLATHYYEGIQGNTSYSVAEKWFKEAAEKGHDGAQASLATIYYEGLLGEKDFNKAFDWYMKSARQGNSGAQNYLGVMYMAGQGIEQNNVIAYAWAKLAAEQGRESAKKLKAHIEKKLTLEEKSESEVLFKEYKKTYSK